MNGNHLQKLSFNYRTKCSLTAYPFGRVDQGNLILINIKAEPEILINTANWLNTSHGLEPMTANKRNELLEVCCQFAGRKERVIGISQNSNSANLKAFFIGLGQAFICPRDGFPIESGHLQITCLAEIFSFDPQAQVEFLGIVSLQNPVRLTVSEAVLRCRRAGIKIFMTSSDHPYTAYTISRVVGITRSKQSMNLEDVHR